MTDTIETIATVSEAPAAENGAVLFVPLGKLKKSSRNARKTPHSTCRDRQDRPLEAAQTVVGQTTVGGCNGHRGTASGDT